MNDTTLALFGALALTGLAGSLHCVGMCGPILVGLSRKLPEGRSFAWDAIAYHGGRLWTYMVLGLIAGAFGQRLEQSWGGRSLFALLLGGIVVLNGALMLRRRHTRRRCRTAFAGRDRPRQRRTSGPGDGFAR